MSEIDLSKIAAWLKAASADDLIDIQSRVTSAWEAKQNEERTRVVEVECDGLRVANFPEGHEVQALEYLLAHKDEVTGSEIHLRHRRVRNSELEFELADRWWK